MSVRLIFDLDDTLYLERDYVRSGFNAVDRHLSATRRLNGFFERAWRLFLDGRRGDIFDGALADLGAAPEKPLIAELVRVYREHRPRVRLAPDAQRFLDSLPPTQPTGLITDGPAEMQSRKVRALGLEGRFTVAILTDRWGAEYSKPHPRAFETIQTELGGDPGDFVYIGDNPFKDFLTPNLMGWRTVQIKREGGLSGEAFAATDRRAHYTIASFDELSSWLSSRG